MSDPKTVLIVEDEKNIVDILSFNLSKEGYETLEAYDGEDDRERQSAEWLRETGMPRTLDDGALIAYVESPDYSFKYLLFPDGTPDLQAVNAAIEEVMPDYGYRIVEE